MHHDQHTHRKMHLKPSHKEARSEQEKGKAPVIAVAFARCACRAERCVCCVVRHFGSSQKGKGFGGP